MEASTPVGTPGMAQSFARASRALTIAGAILLAIIVVLPSHVLRPVDWIVLAYVLVAGIAAGLGLVAVFSKHAAEVVGAVIVYLGINIIGILGVAIVFFTFRMSAP
jgi:hypothetical protein